MVDSFDWPEEMPEGFWGVVGTHGIESRIGPKYRVSREMGTVQWELHKGYFRTGYRDDAIAILVETRYGKLVKRFFYTALREHVLVERAKLKHAEVLAEAKPQPPEPKAPERAEDEIDWEVRGCDFEGCELVKEPGKRPVIRPSQPPERVERETKLHDWVPFEVKGEPSARRCVRCAQIWTPWNGADKDEDCWLAETPKPERVERPWDKWKKYPDGPVHSTCLAECFEWIANKLEELDRLVCASRHAHRQQTQELVTLLEGVKRRLDGDGERSNSFESLRGRVYCLEEREADRG